LETGSQRRDFAWQQQRSRGSSDETTHYNQFNAGSLAVNANQVQAGLGVRDSLEQLARQPGMGWVEQLDNDPRLGGRIDWARVEEAHRNWDYQQQGLTPEGAAIVTLVVSYFTAGTASGLGASAGSAVGGGTAGAVVGGAVMAGVTALASQASVALINNRGDVGGALHELGSSAGVKSLLNAIVTGGVLAGLNLDPTGLPTPGGGAQPLMTQLGQNLTAGVARAVIGTAINGGSFERNLSEGIKAALLDTVAAQGANAIGDLTVDGTLDDFTNKAAHAIAGCMVGAARAERASGCGAGALGAAIGEMAAQAYGRRDDTVQFAALVSGLAVAVTGGDAGQINVGSQAGANAAVNNHDAHPGFGYEYPEIDHPFAPTEEFRARFIGSEEERLVWFRTQEIAQGTAEIREWLRFDDARVQLPRHGGPLYEIFDLGLPGGAGPVRIAYSPKNPRVFYVSLDHYDTTTAQPLKWTRFEAAPSR